jgi:hypothetical protein
LTQLLTDKEYRQKQIDLSNIIGMAEIDRDKLLVALQRNTELLQAMRGLKMTLTKVYDQVMLEKAMAHERITPDTN